jgi:UDP-N-acetylglucosamine 2-epimerase (non-hydrolysing)
MMKILCIAGARPNFMKIAPLMKAFEAEPEIEPMLIHTGQHYDKKMSDLFFRQLEIPEPDVNLGVGSGSHAIQTAAIMTAFEPVVLDEKPDAVLVVGDVNSTIACGLVAVKLGVPLIHVEAGLRSFDRTMPEEINRILTDSISDILFCTEKAGVENLLREGINTENIHLVGNVLIDTLLENSKKADSSQILQELFLVPQKYVLLTLHRPSNVDNPDVLSRILDALDIIQQEMPIVFPIHPRTRVKLESFNLNDRLKRMDRLKIIEPLGYIEFLNLMSNARIVLTDSGGIQEETTILKVPCLTLRENTERPITVEMGSNRLVGTDKGKIIAAYNEVKDSRYPELSIPPLWDGKASGRIAAIIASQNRTRN